MPFQNTRKLISTKFRKIFKEESSPPQINEIEKSIFIHIPKNAGTSIASALGLSITSHITVKEVKSKIGKTKFNKYFSFAIIRNPWDRFLSLYNYARMEESLYHSAINPEIALYGKHLDYELLKGKSLEECAEYLVEGKLRHDKSWNQWRPQSYWLTDENDNIAVNYYGRFEYLEADFNFILSKIGIKDAALPRINNGKEKIIDYRAYYSERSKQIIADYYREDIKRFGYKF